MNLKFLKFESKVKLLLEAKTPISTISTTLKKSKDSIYNTIKCIKRKDKDFNIESVKFSRVSKVTSREKRVISRDLTRSSKKIIKRLLLENSLKISKKKLITSFKRGGILY